MFPLSLRYGAYASAFNDFHNNFVKVIGLGPGDVTLKFTVGHRPPHPTFKDWIEKAHNGCLTCQFVVDAVRLSVQNLRRKPSDIHVLACAIQGYPLQVVITNITPTVLADRIMWMEVFTVPGESQP